MRKGIIEELPVEDASVDWVISNCVINLSPEKERVFAEIARVLKPGRPDAGLRHRRRGPAAESAGPAGAYSSCISGAISEDDYLAGLRAAGLADVEVRERLVYDAAQIAGYARRLSRAPAAAAAPQSTRWCAATRRSLVGKVWSAKVYARKPA